MPMYRVEWTIDVDAENPEAAARKARRYQQWPRPGYWCGVFSVIEHDSGGESVQVDLDELDQLRTIPPTPVPATLGASLEQQRNALRAPGPDDPPLTDREDI